MTEPDVLVASSVRYYHEHDEAAFFGWLARIDCVGRYRGDGCRLVMTLKRRPTEADLRELAAFFFRYDIDLVQLARFETPANRGWLRDPRSFWHARMFGSAR